MTDPIDYLAELTMPQQVEHLKHMLDEVTKPAPEVIGAGLTKCEERVLGLLMRRSGSIVSHDSLLAALAWDRPGKEPCRSAIDVHVCSIRRKLREACIPGEVQTKRGFGYRWVGA